MARWTVNLVGLPPLLRGFRLGMACLPPSVFFGCIQRRLAPYRFSFRVRIGIGAVLGRLHLSIICGSPSQRCQGFPLTLSPEASQERRLVSDQGVLDLVGDRTPGARRPPGEAPA